MTFDLRTETNIATLTPATQALARAYMALATSPENSVFPMVVKIIQGRRTYAEQAALYAQGRTAPGRIVTDAPAGYSNHNFGLAFDIGVFDQYGYIDDQAGKPGLSQEDVDNYYKALAPLGKSVGLFWGGDWQSIQDFPHYELRPFPELSENDTLAKLRAMVANGEVIA